MPCFADCAERVPGVAVRVIETQHQWARHSITNPSFDKTTLGARQLNGLVN